MAKDKFVTVTKKSPGPGYTSETSRGAATTIRKGSKWGKIYEKGRDESMDYYREKHGMEGLDTSLEAAGKMGAFKAGKLAKKSAEYDRDKYAKGK